MTSSLLWTIGKNADFTSDQVIFDELAKDSTAEIELGALKGFYEFRTRGHCSDQIIEKALEFAEPKHHDEVREYAAAYLSRLSRSEGIDLTRYNALLYEAITKEEHPEIKMHLVNALTLVRDKSVHGFIEQQIRSDPDYRTMINLLNACDENEATRYYGIVVKILNAGNPHVQVAAAAFLKRAISTRSVETLIALGDSCSFWKARWELANGVFSKGTKDHISTLLKTDWFDHDLLHSPNDHARAATYQLFSSKPEYYGMLKNIRADETSQMAKTYALEALIALAPELEREALLELQSNLILAASSKNNFEVYTASHGLLNDVFDLSDQLHMVDVLEKASIQWTLPQYFESRLELEKLLLKIKGEAFDQHKLTNPYNHPIDWKLVREIPKNQLMIMHCDKGDITIELCIEESPATVSYLVSLARTGFYDGLDFHRVVPNFVIQGGDPDGNGTGSSRYSLRSEFGWMTYREGTVGIASAGKDTESCQFFITHNATPNLNGRYTIIGKVVDGMDVVHSIQVGDIINSVEAPAILQ